MIQGWLRKLCLGVFRAEGKASEGRHEPLRRIGQGVFRTSLRVARFATVHRQSDRRSTGSGTALPPARRRLRTRHSRGEAAISETVAPAPWVRGSDRSFQCANGGPINSASMLISMASPTPTLVPAAGIPKLMPNSERFTVPCAEKPMRAFGSMLAMPA